MENFFTVVALTSSAVILFAIYYSARGLWKSYQRRKTAVQIKQKIYKDEKNFVRNYLRIQLGKLKTGELSWILISSRLYPQDKLEMTINPKDSSLQINTRLRRIDSVETEHLRKMGMVGSDYHNEINSLSMPVNTRIATDVVYYCFEKIAEHGNTHNLKISTSGG